MNNLPTANALEAKPMKPFINNINCKQCRSNLDNFINEVLNQGHIPEDSPIPWHLEGCPGCSQAYIHLMDLAMAPQVKALQEALIYPDHAPDNLAGLLALWQKQLAACNRLEDLRGAAVGLSVIGMIRRQLGEVEEARLVHELALQTAQENQELLSGVMSHTDLGYLALHNNQIQEAMNHLWAARGYAIQLVDKESQIRVQVLLSKAQQKGRDSDSDRDLQQISEQIRIWLAGLVQQRQQRIGLVMAAGEDQLETMQAIYHDSMGEETILEAVLVDGPRIMPNGAFILTLELPKDWRPKLVEKSVTVRWQEKQLAAGEIQRDYIVIREKLPAEVLPDNWNEVVEGMPIPTDELIVLIKDISVNQAASQGRNQDA